MPAPGIGKDQRTMAERLAQKESEDEARRAQELHKRRSRRAGNKLFLEGRARKEAAEKERLAKQEAVVAELFTADVSALPDELRNNPIVLNALRNKATAQAILNEHYEKIQRGAAGADEALEMALKLFGQVQAATTDVLAKWSKQAEDKPMRRIPKSVADWIVNAAEYEGPIVVQEEGK